MVVICRQNGRAAPSPACDDRAFRPAFVARSPEPFPLPPRRTADSVKPPPVHVQFLAVAALAAAAVATLAVPLDLDMAALREEARAAGARIAALVPRGSQAETGGTRPSPGPAPPDPLAALDPDLAAELLGRPPSAPASRFHRLVTVDPAAFCAALSERGLPMGPFGGGPLASRAGLCVSDLVEIGPRKPAPPVEAPVLAVSEDGEVTEVEPPPQPRPSTLFLAVHGDADGRLARLRLKIAIEDRDTAAATKTRAVAVVSDLFDLMDVPLPSGIPRAIDRLDPIERDLGEVRVTMRREWGDVPRFNLVIDLPRPADPPAGHFAVPGNG